MRKFLFVFLAIIVFCLVGYSYILNLPNRPLELQEETVFSIPQGSHLQGIARNLVEEGIISKSRYLVWPARLFGSKTIYAGEYKLRPGMTIKDAYELFTAGEALSDEITVTVVEGVSLVDIAELFVQQGLIDDSESFIEAASSDLERFYDDYPFLSELPKTASLEGFLFPDTYRFFKGSSNDEILSKMLTNYTKKVGPELIAAIEASGRSMFDAIVLASIVEREVRAPEEMKIVAGIFQNRLSIGMALQADSTIEYVTDSGRDRSTVQDLAIDSLYNTYRFAGLPPGPISNPGLNAIMAAINPEETDYLYFLTDRAGRVYYAKTFEEHQRNRRFLDRN